MSSDGTSGYLLAMTDKVKAALKVKFDLYSAFSRIDLTRFFSHVILCDVFMIHEIDKCTLTRFLLLFSLFLTGS